MMNVLVILLGLGLAANAQDQAPATGDVGVIRHCVATGEEGDECESCFEQREEEAEEDEERAEFSAVEKCIDICSSGYRITQLSNSFMIDPDCEDDDCQEEEYLRIKMEPEQSCIQGCGCPNATGYAKYEAKEDGDNDYEEQEKEQEMAEYELKFWTTDGSINSYYSGGRVKMDRKEAEGDYAQGYATNDVELELQYLTTEINEDGEVEQREEDCRANYFLESGMFDGFKAQSGSSAPAVAEGPALSTSGNIELVSSSEGCSSFENGTTDACFYHCIEKLEVDTTDGTFLMKSFAGNADIEDCDCYKGYGVQTYPASTYQSTGAYISFEEDASSEVCSSVFDSSSTIANISFASGNSNGFTMSWRTSSYAICESTYEIVSGSVLGLQAATTTTTTTANHRSMALEEGPITVIIPLMALILVVSSFGFIFACRGRA